MVYVAEGTYGCVYRPPIKCKKGKKYRFGKVSKLMTRDAAKKEMKEYEFIETVDKKNKYYPGPPIECEPDPIDADHEILPGECRVFEKNPNINDYKLLIYNDGGYDLNKFTQNNLTIYLSPNPQEQTDLFFLNAYNLFEGLKLFINKDLLHHDIKPQNIVFEPATFKFNYIDFGLAEKKSVLVSEIISELNHENFHWSYPLEFGLLNDSKSYYFKNLDEDQLNDIKEEITQIIVDENTPNTYSIKPRSFNSFFRYAENRLSPVTKEKFIEDVFRGLRNYIHNPEKTYALLVNKLLGNVDVYALGFTMNHMINMFYDKGALSENDYFRYNRLFQRMFHPDINIRTGFNINDYTNWYAQILKNTGVLSRLGKQIVDGKIADIGLTPTKSSLSASTASSASVASSASSASSSSKPSPLILTSSIKTCPAGQELNPITKRCRNVCPPNHYRDSKQNCKKIKVVDLVSYSSSTRKVCPPGKEINIVTGRCRNVCKRGTVRNKKGNCVKI